MCGSGYSGEKTSKKQSRDTTYTNQRKYRDSKDDLGFDVSGKSSKDPRVVAKAYEGEAIKEKTESAYAEIKKESIKLKSQINAKTAAMRNELVNKKRLNYFGTQYNIIEGADESTPSLTGGIGVSSQKIVKLG